MELEIEGLKKKLEIVTNELESLRKDLKEAFRLIEIKQAEIDKLKKNGGYESINGKANKNKLNTMAKDRTSVSSKSGVNNSKKCCGDCKIKNGNTIIQDEFYASKTKSELKVECKMLTKKVNDMEQFFTDYGLVWVGDDGEHGDECRMTHTARTFSPNFDKIFSIIDELNITATEPQIVHTKTGATFKHCELMNLTLYSDGMQVENEKFREYSSLSVQEFFRDLEDGYYPTELKGAFPHGVVFKIIDKRDTNYLESKGFTGKGYKLGNCHDDNEPQTLGEILNNEEDNKVKRDPKGIYVYERKYEVTSHKKDGECILNKERKMKMKNNKINNKKNVNTPESSFETPFKRAPSTPVDNNKLELLRKNKIINGKNLSITSITSSDRPPHIKRSSPITQKNSDFEEIWVNKHPERQSSTLFHKPVINVNKIEGNQTIKTLDKPNSELNFDWIYEKLLQLAQYETGNNPSIRKNLQSLPLNVNLLIQEKEEEKYKSQAGGSQQSSAKPDNLIDNKQRYGKADVHLVSTDTSDHVLINLPSKTSGSKESEKEDEPHIKITNINYREAPININVTPNNLLSLLNEMITCDPDAEMLYCKGGQLVIDGIAYKCGPDCVCPCQHKDDKDLATCCKIPKEGKSKETNVKIFGTTDMPTAYTEYADRYRTPEKDFYTERAPAPATDFDPTTKYEHFEFLGKPFTDDENEKEVKAKVVEKSQKKPVKTTTQLNNKTRDSEISIRITVNDKNYLAYVHPDDQVSKVLGMIMMKGDFTNGKPTVSINDKLISGGDLQKPVTPTKDTEKREKEHGHHENTELEDSKSEKSKAGEIHSSKQTGKEDTKSEKSKAGQIHSVKESGKEDTKSEKSVHTRPDSHFDKGDTKSEKTNADEIHSSKPSDKAGSKKDEKSEKSGLEIVSVESDDDDDV